MKHMFSRRKLLAGTACAAVPTFANRRVHADSTSRGTAKNLITVHAVGGWDPSYTFDPKAPGGGVDVPNGGTLRTVSGFELLDDPTRPSVREFFADFGARTSVVNGLQTATIAHTEGYRRILTGATSHTAPDMGSVVAAEHGLDRAAPYLVLGTVSFSGPYASLATRTGTLNQLGTLLVPEGGFPLTDGTFGIERYIPTAAEDTLIAAHQRASAERAVARLGTLGRNGVRSADFAGAIDRAAALRGFDGLAQLDFARSFAFQVDLAIEALASGMTAACALELQGWDTHVDNAAQGPLWEQLFAQLHRLVSGLQQRDLLEQTVVVVVSEMGRTPRLNEAGGKDHWPVTSALVVGGEIAGGRVLGGSTADLAGHPVNLASGEIASGGTPLRHSNFAAGVLSCVGVDPQAYLGAVAALGGL